MPQTAHGQIEVLIGDLTQKTISGLAFRPGAVFFLARAKNTAHLGDAWGVITANGQVGRWGQFSHGTHQEDGLAQSWIAPQIIRRTCARARRAAAGAGQSVKPAMVVVYNSTSVTSEAIEVPAGATTTAWLGSETASPSPGNKLSAKS